MQPNHVIRVLGPIDIGTPSGPRPVGSRNARALLAALVVAGGRAVATDELRAAIWGDSPPRTADNSLQTYISRLRHRLGPGSIERADHTYRLAVERDQIDALRFEALLVRATELRTEPERCHELSRVGLALWRGRPFGDLGEEEPFRLEVIRLDELRLAMMELSLESELALGLHEIAVAELESAVREHPYRERLWYLLVDALLRDDRRVEALRACHDLRTALAEAGLDPGAELAQWEDRIIRSGSAPDDTGRSESTARSG